MELFWLITSALPIVGHVMYGLPGRSRVRLLNGDDFSPSDRPPHPERLQHVRAVTMDGEMQLRILGDRGTAVEIDAGSVESRPAWVVVETPLASIELAPQKFLSYLEHEGLLDVIAKREASGQANEPGREVYSKYTKTALSDHNGSVRLLNRPVGLPVEIVPLTPGPIHAGDTVRSRVLSQGMPVPDVQVRVSCRGFDANSGSADILVRTNGNGEFDIELSQPGYWRLHTIVMSESRTKEADWQSWWASLTFAVAG